MRFKNAPLADRGRIAAHLGGGWFVAPVAAANTIRQGNANACPVVGRGAQRSSVSRSTRSELSAGQASALATRVVESSGGRSDSFADLAGAGGAEHTTRAPFDRARRRWITDMPTQLARPMIPGAAPHVDATYRGLAGPLRRGKRSSTRHELYRGRRSTTTSPRSSRSRPNGVTSARMSSTARQRHAETTRYSAIVSGSARTR